MSHTLLSPMADSLPREVSDDFRQELSQLVHHYLDQGVPPAEIVDMLEIQTEFVRTRTGYEVELPSDSYWEQE